MTKQRILAAVFSILATSSGVSTPPLLAQQPVRVSGDVVCAECVITIDTVLTLGGLEGEGMEAIDMGSAITIDARKRILITNLFHPRIYVFDMAGRFLRSVGRQGEGPGEYSTGISHINAGPRYIHVFEYHTGRTVLDHDFKFVRRDRFPGQVTRSFAMDSEIVAFSTWIPTPAGAGHKLHLLAPSGELKSYGGDDSAYRKPVRFGGDVTGDGTSLWSIEYESTRVTRWDLLPKPAPARIWERTVDEWDRYDRGPDIFPVPGNTGVMLDENGLWITWNAPDSGWEGSLPEGGGPLSDPLQDVYDSWVELLDPDTGESLARYFDKGMFLGFAQGSRYLVAYHETDAGVPYIHLLEPRLSRGAGSPSS